MLVINECKSIRDINRYHTHMLNKMSEFIKFSETLIPNEIKIAQEHITQLNEVVLKANIKCNKKIREEFQRRYVVVQKDYVNFGSSILIWLMEMTYSNESYTSMTKNIEAIFQVIDSKMQALKEVIDKAITGLEGEESFLKEKNEIHAQFEKLQALVKKIQECSERRFVVARTMVELNEKKEKFVTEGTDLSTIIENEAMAKVVQSWYVSIQKYEELDTDIDKNMSLFNEEFEIAKTHSFNVYERATEIMKQIKQVESDGIKLMGECTFFFAFFERLLPNNLQAKQIIELQAERRAAFDDFIKSKNRFGYKLFVKMIQHIVNESKIALIKLRGIYQAHKQGNQ